MNIGLRAFAVLMAATIVSAGKPSSGKANASPGLIDETSLNICAINNIHKDAKLVFDLEFEGYISREQSSIKAEGRPLYCATDKITDD